MPPVFSRELTNTIVLSDERTGQGRTSPCENKCPLSNPIQKMEKALADGDAGLALTLLRASNPFPGITGRICQHPCEGGCNRSQYDEPLSIRSLERYAADAGNADFTRMQPLPSTGKKIAVIGSGPAGMSCAYFSALLGHAVTVFEAAPVAGGAPRQSIPDFRLPKHVVDHEVGLVLDLGVSVLTNTEVGRDIPLSDILNRFDACLLAVGNRRERMLSIPGIEYARPAVSFLREANLSRMSLKGKKVVILGGGGVAFDCAFTARRLGAEQTSLICLEKKDAIRVPLAELQQSEEESIALYAGYLAASVETADSHVSAVTANGVSSFSFDEKGALRAEFLPDGQLRVDADIVICASGLMTDLALLDQNAATAKVEKTPRGCVKCSHGHTSLPGLFAAGDCATGPSLVATAVADGRRTAFEIHAWLQGEEAGLPLTVWKNENGCLALSHPEVSAPQHQVAFEEIINLPYHPKADRKQTKNLAAKDTWLAFEELDKGFSPEDAQEEAKRCLHCGHCQNCGECVASCPGLILKKGENGPEVAYPDECWHCGCCRLACPGACISFKFPLHTML